MVTFSFIKPPARGSLRRRRMADALRRLTAALCVGLAVLFGIEAVLAVVETEPMVVAARSIRRGDIILAADVQLADMPVSAAGPSWTGNIEDVVGKVAQIDIEAADPISTHMARDAPVAPTGTTVIEVRLASSVDDVLAGDQVRLVSAVGCEGADCTLAENATVMNVGKPDAIGALGATTDWCRSQCRRSRGQGYGAATGRSDYGRCAVGSGIGLRPILCFRSRQAAENTVLGRTECAPTPTRAR